MVSTPDAHPPTQPAPDVPTPGKPDSEHYCDVLRNIVDIGLHHIQATAKTPAGTQAETPDQAQRAANAFNRLASNVRYSIVLATQLANPKSTTTKPTQSATERTSARKHILLTVEDAIRTLVAEQDRDEAYAGLRERLDTQDMENELATRPAKNIAKGIIRDFGITASPGLGWWKSRDPEAAKPAPPKATHPQTKARAHPRRHNTPNAPHPPPVTSTDVARMRAAHAGAPTSHPRSPVTSRRSERVHRAGLGRGTRMRCAHTGYGLVGLAQHLPMLPSSRSDPAAASTP